MPRVKYEGEAATLGSVGRIMPQGHGSMTYLDGADVGCRYEGDFLGEEHGYAHGQRNWYRPDGTLEYEGEWQQGHYHGSGRLWYFEDSGYPGYRYEGDFVESMCHGQGSWYRPDNTLEYEGDWEHSERHGQGILYKGGRVARVIAHPRPSPDPDKEISTIRLLR